MFFFRNTISVTSVVCVVHVLCVLVFCYINWRHISSKCAMLQHYAACITSFAYTYADVMAENQSLKSYK